MNVPERLMLLNNASMLSKANYQAFGDVLQLLGSYHSEQDENVWGIITLIVAVARRCIELDERVEDQIKAFLSRFIPQEYKRVGWAAIPTEAAPDRKLATTILRLSP